MQQSNAFNDPATPAVTAVETGEAGWLHELLGAEIVRGLTVQGLVLIAVVVGAAWVVSKLVQGALSRTFQSRAHTDAGSQLVVLRLTHYLIMLAGIFLALNLAGFSFTSMFAAGAVFAVVLGFALQNLSENFVSGVILMVERTITPGDVLEVEDRVVRVVHMGIRSTVARTRDDEDVIIPNSKLVTSTVKNYTLRDSLYRLRSGVGVSYSSDMALVRKVLEETGRDFEKRNTTREPRVLLREFGSNAVEWEVSVWIEDPWHAPANRSQLNEAIWYALKEARITIAYPQLDLHLDREVIEALRARRETES